MEQRRDREIRICFYDASWLGLLFTEIRRICRAFCLIKEIHVQINKIIALGGVDV